MSGRRPGPRGVAKGGRRRPNADRRHKTVIVISAAVRRALQSHSAVVALETSVVAQGLPPPDGVAAAKRCESAVRGVGALPATIGVLEGQIVVGMSPAQIERLADRRNPVAKAGERDLAALCAAEASAGTTVSATCAIAAHVGIRVVATGGIGGVHRAPPGEIDVSSDLTALARLPVAVVCAGAKAVLDLDKTVEVLEALSVLVLGFDTPEFPNFYSARSGIPVEHVVTSPRAVAKTLRLRFETLKQGGVLVVQSPPAGGLSAESVESAVAGALASMSRAGIKGKDVTPYLLGEVDRRTRGEARRVNLDLLEANAALAGRIAVEYAKSAA